MLDGDGTALEAKDLELDLLDKRLVKLETVRYALNGKTMRNKYLLDVR